MEIQCSIDALHQAETYLKELDYYRAQGDDPNQNQHIRTALFKLLLPFVVREKDRNWLKLRTKE